MYETRLTKSLGRQERYW